MADNTEFGENVADTTVAYDDLRLDPSHITDDGKEPAPVWTESQYLRELIERGKRGQNPSPADRGLLARATLRQVRTLGLYREIARLRFLLADPTKPKKLTLYVLLFPGEGRDNTGIKDLNDKVLGYELSNEFIQKRQKEIETIFPPTAPTSANPPPEWFATVGQDYKTASIVAVGKTPQKFKDELVRLDAALRQHLLDLLTRAEAGTTDRKRLDEIGKLKKKLKPRKYRFDFLFGVNTVPVGRGGGQDAVDVLLRLVTEALKGAGMARFAAKAKSLKTSTGRRFGQGPGPDIVPKGHDARGRVFGTVPFLRVLRTARDIKETVSAGFTAKSQINLQDIFVDQVWTVAFLPHKRLYWANPDVIRDVRKKALVPPELRRRQGIKFAFADQKDVLELWLVTVNMLDFVKDFLTAEQTGKLHGYHAQALGLLELLYQADGAIDWSQLEFILTRDIQRTPEPLPVLGTTSEYRFYGPASDHTDRLFFTMDIRDLGVEVISSYEVTTKVVDEGQLGEENLVRQTLQSTDTTVLRRRITYASVAAVFRKKYAILAQRPDRHAHAIDAFGGPIDPTPLPAFERSVQIMLGGDEVFVAAHPYYSLVEQLIIAELAGSSFAPDQPLNMRTGVVYSSATRVPSGAGSSGVSGAQRKENQIAHDRAMKLAADAPGMLKPLERAHRRIERLIEKLEAKDAKAVKGQFYRRSLESLGLLRLYARAKRGFARPLSDNMFDRLRRLLRQEDIAGALQTGLFELVDFQGKVVDYNKLAARLAELEANVVRDVGADNRHFDAPPPRMFPPIPKWLQKLIDMQKRADDEDAKKKNKQQQPSSPSPAVAALLSGRPTSPV